MAIIFDYSRPGPPVSLRPGGFPRPRSVPSSAPQPAGKLSVLKGHDFSRAENCPNHIGRLGTEGWLSRQSSKIAGRCAIAITGVLLAALPVAAQYAGKVPESSKKNGPDLRAVAVLEWTGDPGKPKASRLVPITLWDGQDLQDASIYMAQPAPLALQSEVEYKLEQNGKTIGYYDISSAGQSQGTWIGFGSWKPLTQPKPAAPPQKIEEAGDDGGPPVLHRKNKPGASSKSSTPAPAPDPDRPTLHAPPKSTKPAAEKPHSDEGYSEPIASAPDPDRPHLFHGKASSTGGEVLPTLAGLPPEMHQTIAVSDARNHPDHEWTYSWANPEDEAKMKSELEDLARKALAPPPPPEPAKPTARRRAATGRRRAKPTPPPPPMPLADEKFHVFQLTYGGPATMVFSAHTQISAPPPAIPADETRLPTKLGTGGKASSADEARPPLKADSAGKSSSADETRPPLKGNAAGKGSDADENRPQLKGSAAGKVSDRGEEDVSSQTGATQEKFITLIAQPDLYGNVRVLFKNVTDASDLDDNPVMRLIDPVDAMADNRGELLFELRGSTQRQFALYRIIDGRVEKLFTTSPESVAMPVAPAPGL